MNATAMGSLLVWLVSMQLVFCRSQNPDTSESGRVSRRVSRRAFPYIHIPRCRFGSLYGELARWVLRLLGWGRSAQKTAALQQQQQQQQRPGGVPLLPTAASAPAVLPTVGSSAAPGFRGPDGGRGQGFDAAWGRGAAQASRPQQGP